MLVRVFHGELWTVKDDKYNNVFANGGLSKWYTLLGQSLGLVQDSVTERELLVLSEWLSCT